MATSTPIPVAAAASSVQYGYDARGLLTSRTAQDGTVAAYGYDSLGRLVRREFSAGTLHTFAYNGVGRMVLAVSNDGSHSVQKNFVYDEMGDVISQMQTLDGAPYTPRDEIFAEISHHDYYSPRRCVRTYTHKLILVCSSAPRFMDPSQSWRPRSDTVFADNNVGKGHKNVELYDLKQDPWELHNVADDPAHRAVRRDLMTRLRRHLVETDDPILQGAITPPFHWKALELLEREGV